MNKSLLEQLPEIVRNGRRRVEQILESLEGKTRDELQTRELVTPARDSNWKMFPAVKTAGKPGAHSCRGDAAGQRGGRAGRTGGQLFRMGEQPDISLPLFDQMQIPQVR